jgi:site-specific DNA recombinase
MNARLNDDCGLRGDTGTVTSGRGWLAAYLSTMTTNIAIYTRLSKDESGTQTATRRQEQNCRAFAALREWEVDAVYEDVDLSAFKKGVVRPSYEELLRAIEERHIAGVVVWKLDRLVRRPAEFERFWAICEAGGAILASATEPIDTSTDLGLALVRILVSFAGLESATFGLRVRARLGEMARAGNPPSIVGFGYKKHPVRIVPRQGVLIQDAAEKVLAGHSLRSIATDWNRKGARTIYGNLWKYNTVKDLLCSPRLVGDRVHKGEVVATDCWPAILDRDVAERVRIILLAPRGASESNLRRHLLTGLVFCGRCMSRLNVTNDRGVLAYRCSTTPKGCGNLQVNRDALDGYVFDAACRHLDGISRSGYEPQDSSRSDVSTARAEIGNQRDRLKDLRDDYFVHQGMSQKEYRAYRDTLLDQVNATVTASGLRSADLGNLPSGRAMRASWPMLDVAHRRAQLDLVISRIVVSPARRKDFDPRRVEVHWYREADDRGRARFDRATTWAVPRWRCSRVLHGATEGWDYASVTRQHEPAYAGWHRRRVV